MSEENFDNAILSAAHLIAVKYSGWDSQDEAFHTVRADIEDIIREETSAPSLLAERDKLRGVVEELVDALESILNIEGPALRGGDLGAFKGLDVPWHFAKVRAALRQARGEE